jgi:hypothetical protein
MRRLMLIAAALIIGGLGWHGATAQQAPKEQGTAEEMKVTGTVTEADEETREITIEGQKYVMDEHGGAALFPQAGDEITLFYEEKGERKVITRIGQAME